MISRQEIQLLADEIAAKFAVDRIILFGSYAYGTPTPDSDVDLLVVMEFEGRAFEKSLEILNAVDRRFPLDLLAIRPEELAKRYREFNPIARESLDKGHVLYDRRSAQVVQAG